ncbi:hypothetical protein C0989_005661 [Termitomyces sp. Mn162]|nr:hypothetical protein C0989_005661 [Termitomyces sp. Mn162]
MDNPTVDVFEKRVTCLEDGIAAIASASGLVAQFMALSCLANSGDNILKSSSSFMASQRNSHREHSPEAVDPLYCESTGNPRYNVPDIPALAALAHRHSIPLVVDNTFGACGTIAGPLDLGADIAVESATKVIEYVVTVQLSVVLSWMVDASVGEHQRNSLASLLSSKVTVDG